MLIRAVNACLIHYLLLSMFFFFNLILLKISFRFFCCFFSAYSSMITRCVSLEGKIVIDFFLRILSTYWMKWKSRSVANVTEYIRWRKWHFITCLNAIFISINICSSRFFRLFIRIMVQAHKSHQVDDGPHNPIVFV